MCDTESAGVGFRRAGMEEKPQKHTLSSGWVNNCTC